MENNRENAIKFFGANINCLAKCRAVLFQPSSGSKNHEGHLKMSPSVLADIHEGTFSYGDFYLLQKPLSSITDEDAIEVAKLQAPTFDNNSKVLRFDNSIEIHRLNYVVKITHEISTFHRGILLMVGGAAQTMYAYDSLVFTDYLRSRGYALPYMGLSVEKLVEYGWIKLKE